MTETNQRRIDVFFYGLFMDEALLIERGVDPQDRRIAQLKNFCLVIGQRATLMPRAREEVYGVVFSLTHREVDLLYSESSVREYRPEAVSVHLRDGNIIPALCFNLPSSRLFDERNVQYAAKLKQLAERIGLPAEYVGSI